MIYNGSSDLYVYVQGVRAVIIEKDNKPKWIPARLEDVEDSFISALFKKFDEQEIAILSPELYDL